MEIENSFQTNTRAVQSPPSIMGLLSLGTPLSWEEAAKLADHVRAEGVKQFINAYKKGKDHNPNFWTWGDEIEYVLVELDDQKQKAYLNIEAEKAITLINEEREEINSIWHPEYAKFMLESTPLEPYGRTFKNFLQVESNMQTRRQAISKYLKPNDLVLSVANFPALGTISAFKPNLIENGITNEASRSCFIPDEVINSHARFKTLTRNIRTRRGQKVEISLPLFMDTDTDPLISSKLPRLFPEESASSLILEQNQVYMDCMAFGMGCCCLQVTFQASDISQARFVYDQFTVLSPLMLALTAASPVFRGILVDTDCRWSVIESAVDDRTREERGLEPLLHSKNRIPKSRYASVSRFISEKDAMRPEYNDLDTPINPEVFESLISAGIDETLALHLAHLFIRDPLVIFSELLNQDNCESSDHFENIQSTNWQTCRFKPPSLTLDLGWRVEFRPMEVQLDDTYNAAFAIYSILLIRAIIHFNVALYLPLSLVDANMVKAQKRDAVLQESFYFRTNFSSPKDQASISLLPLSDIFLQFNELIRKYLQEMAVESSIYSALDRYISLIEDRSTGVNLTPARITRDFIQSHPLYKNDSLVTDEIIYDLTRHFSNFE